MAADDRRREGPATTVVFADDHPAIIDAVGRYLAGAGFEVLATVRHGEAALSAVQEHKPMVCLADVQMPKMNGVELTRRLGAAAPETRVLLYSGVADPALASQALEAGARGFALKDAPLQELARAIRVVSGGGLYIDPVIAAPLALGRSDEAAHVLTKRERAVLQLLAAGKSYGEIGIELFLSPNTVRAYGQRAVIKLGAQTRTEAVAIALRAGLID